MTSKQRAYLMSLASTLDPIFQIGKSSLTPEITSAIEECFNTHELIKINVLKNCFDDPKEMAYMLAERTKSQVVQVIGKKIVLYKENKDNKGTNKNVKTYLKDYCRKHLSAAYYDNWECERIARQIRDDYRIKDELEYLLKSGYSFERGIDILVRDEKIVLKDDFIIHA